MRNDLYSSQLMNYSSQNKKLWAMVFCLGLLCLLLAAYIVSIKNNQKTIIVPTNVNKPFSVQGDVYDNAYKEQMAIYITSLLLNFQPNNVRHQFNELLKYVLPANYQALRTKLSSDAKQIVTNGTSSVFYPSNTVVDQNTVTVKGEVVGSIGQEIVTRKPVEIVLTIDTSNGFFISGWSARTPGIDQAVESAEQGLTGNEVSADKDFLSKVN